MRGRASVAACMSLYFYQKGYEYFHRVCVGPVLGCSRILYLRDFVGALFPHSINLDYVCICAAL
jgi:hypothetical protein